jgi:hypothetical protein
MDLTEKPVAYTAEWKVQHCTGCHGRGDRHGTAALLIEDGIPLEPIQEVTIQEQRVGLVNRRSMMRIIASRMNAAADRV